MTRDQARQLLDRVRAGKSRASQRLIRQALRATGDLPSMPITWASRAKWPLTKAAEGGVA